MNLLQRFNLNKKYAIILGLIIGATYYSFCEYSDYHCEIITSVLGVLIPLILLQLQSHPMVTTFVAMIMAWHAGHLIKSFFKFPNKQ